MFNREAIEKDAEKAVTAMLDKKYERPSSNMPATTFGYECTAMVTFWKELSYADWNDFTRKKNG